MFNVLIIIALVLCIVLAFTVLIQNPKGGGLSGTFGGAANQLFGYKRTTDDIEKITWWLVVAVFVLCLSASAFKPVQSEQVNDAFSPQAQQPATQQQQQPVTPETQEQEPTDNNSNNTEQLPIGN